MASVALAGGERTFALPRPAEVVYELYDLRIYEVQDGAVIPCRDVVSLRVDPPFRVISKIMGEEEWEAYES